jgi:hypothetical protein
VDAQLTGDHEITLYLNSVEPPYEMTEPTASITFRPRNPEVVLDAIRRRIEMVKEGCA